MADPTRPDETAPRGATDLNRPVDIDRPVAGDHALRPGRSPGPDHPADHVRPEPVDRAVDARGRRGTAISIGALILVLAVVGFLVLGGDEVDTAVGTPTVLDQDVAQLSPDGDGSGGTLGSDLGLGGDPMGLEDPFAAGDSIGQDAVDLSNDAANSALDGANRYIEGTPDPSRTFLDDADAAAARAGEILDGETDLPAGGVPDDARDTSPDADAGGRSEDQSDGLPDVRTED